MTRMGRPFAIGFICGGLWFACASETETLPAPEPSNETVPSAGPPDWWSTNPPQSDGGQAAGCGANGEAAGFPVPVECGVELPGETVQD